MRLVWLFFVVAVVLLLPFLFWGDVFTEWLSGEAGIERLRQCGEWGWLAVIGLLVADLLLPVPSTPVMSAAGFLYGVWMGGLIGATGSFLSGMLAYGLSRRFGHRLALRLAGPEELARGERLFAQRGAWLVALSRWMPLLPEAIACLAGLTRMPLMTFMAALACGCLPMAFAFASIGAVGQANPSIALGLSAIVPALLWAVFQWRVKNRP
jgi:uncharacterized membrane protein YdjX (TVP38/TMEM64 family)